MTPVPGSSTSSADTRILLQRFMETYRGQAEARHLECVYKLLQRVGDQRRGKYRSVIIATSCTAEQDIQVSHSLLFALVMQQQEAIIDVAAIEMEAACSEVGLQQQLEELEALILQRGLLGSDDGYVVVCAFHRLSNMRDCHLHICCICVAIKCRVHFVPPCACFDCFLVLVLMALGAEPQQSPQHCPQL